MLDTRNWAPVVIFAYRRPDHFLNTLTSLMRCDGFWQSPVIVYCDGPRDADETDAAMVVEHQLYKLISTQIWWLKECLHG